MAGDLLDFPDVVVKQDVGEFVADVAVGASRVVARVVHGDGPAVGQVEGGGAERAGLEPLQFFVAGAVNEMVRRDDFDFQVLGELPEVEHVVGAQPQLGPVTFGEPVSFGFEILVARLPPAGRAVSAGGELVLHVLEQVTG